MKVLAVLLLCAFAAVQGRSAVGQSTKSVAALGDNPWIVHLRLAVSTSGYLESCAGTLIDNRWVLTSASCVSDVRFIWIRYGVVKVINPSLVTEVSTVRVSPDNTVALVPINRYVEKTDFIAPISPSGGSLPASASFCSFGHTSDGAPGEELSCFDVELEVQEDGTIIGSGADEITRFDLGAPIVNDRAQVALLVSAADDNSAGTFVATAGYVEWIESETGLVLNPDAVEPEPEPEPETADNSLLVKFVD